MGPRLTRQESAARTRARIIDVAERSFLKHGYAATSLERVAETAGFSKGAVYGNFTGKEELCIAVIDRHYADLFKEFAGELAAAAETLDARITVFTRWWEKVLGENTWRLLTIELATQARTNRTLQSQLGERDQWVRRAWASLLERQYHELGMTPPLPANELAVVLIAMAGGIAMQRSIDPDIPGTLLGDAIRLLMTPAAAPAKRNARSR